MESNATDILDLIDLGLTGSDNSGWADERGPWRMSGIGECSRKLSLSLVQWLEGQEPIAPDAKQRRIFDHGTAIGEMIEGAALKAQPDAGSSGPIFHVRTQEKRTLTWDPGWGASTWSAFIESIQGTAAAGVVHTAPDEHGRRMLVLEGCSDIEIVHPGERFDLFDVKSANPRSFSFKKKGSGSSGDYAAQFALYMLSIEQGNPGASFGTLGWVYYDKGYDDLALVETSELECRSWGSAALERAAECILAAAVTPDALPGTNFRPDLNGKLPWQCSYCDHQPIACGAFHPNRVTATAGRGMKPNFVVEVRS